MKLLENNNNTHTQKTKNTFTALCDTPNLHNLHRGPGNTTQTNLHQILSLSGLYTSDFLLLLYATDTPNSLGGRDVL